MLISGSFLSSTISPKDAISYLDKYVWATGFLIHVKLPF